MRLGATRQKLIGLYLLDYEKKRKKLHANRAHFAYDLRSPHFLHRYVSTGCASPRLM